MNDERVFLCGGAAGSQGGAMARQLMEAGYAVTTIARNKKKCEELKAKGIDARPGDLGDIESLKAACHGIEYIALVLPLERDKSKLTLYTDNVIEVCKSAGVRNLVFNTSSRVPQEDNNVPGFAEKRLVEEKLQDSGVPFICLRPTIYMENLAAPWSVTDVNENSVVKYPIAKDRKIMWNSADDVARYVVSALKKTELAGRSFDIGGPEAAGGDDIARQFSAALGRDVKFEGISPSAFAESLLPFLGEAQAVGLVSYYEFVNAHAEHWARQSEDIALLACEPRDNFESWVQRMRPGVFR